MKHLFILRITLGWTLLVAGIQPVLAQEIVRTTGSGTWNSTTLWSNLAVPDTFDTAIISAGDTVNFPASTTQYYGCLKLILEPGSVMILNSSNFLVMDSTIVGGTLTDIQALGINVFRGHMRIVKEGKLDFAVVNNAARVIFYAGITNEGDSSIINRCSFLTQNQAISGTSPILILGTCVIGPGLTLENVSEAGLVLVTGALQGSDSASVFANRTQLIVRSTANLMQIGQVDYLTEGNQVRYQGPSGLTVRAGDYYDLILMPDDTAGSIPQRSLGGVINVYHQFYAMPSIRLQPKKAIFTSYGEALVNCTVFDNDTAGVMMFDDVNMSGTLLDGSGVALGTYLVKGDLIVSDGNLDIAEANLQVEGTLRILGNRRVNVTVFNGIRIFNRVEIAPAARMTVTGTTQNQYLEFKGAVYNAGLLALDGGGTYIFRDSLNLLPQSNFSATSNRGNFYLQKGIRLDGNWQATPASFILRDSLIGAGVMALTGPALVDSGATVVNALKGGLLLTGTLNGRDTGSKFINQGILSYGPADITPPMSIGAFDACTHPENIVLFASTASNQQVPAGCYQNLSTLGGTKQMINGDVELNGNLDLSTNLVKASTALSQTRLLLTGDREQHLGGNGLGAVDNLIVEKTGGEVILDESIAILDALFMTRGVIKADPGVLLLGGSAVIQETDQSYVLGQVATQRKLNAGSGNNFGGLGIRIRTGAESLLGQTVVIRTTGEAREPGQINRSFEIIPTNTQGIDVNIEFYYDLFDLTGANEEELVLEHSVNGAPYVPLETIMHIDTNMIEVRNLTELGIITARPGDMAVSAYPSPMYGDELTIEYVMEQGGRVNINVFDLSGHSVAREITEGFPGHNIHRLTEMDNLAPGIYFVRIKARDEKRVGTQKFIRIVPR